MAHTEPLNLTGVTGPPNEAQMPVRELRPEVSDHPEVVEVSRKHETADRTAAMRLFQQACELAFPLAWRKMKLGGNCFVLAPGRSLDLARAIAA